MSATHTLGRGEHATLVPRAVVLIVDVAAAVELSGLLLTGSGRVRTDADLVFYNQLTGPGVRLRADLQRLEVDLDDVPADVERIRAVVGLANATGRFDALDPPVARVLDAAGTELFRYTVVGLTDESIVVALELSRRGGSWSVQAVGQGHPGDFADFVTDHGVDVELPAPLVAAQPVRRSTGRKVTLRKDGSTALTLVQLSLGWDPVRRRSLFGNRDAEIDLDASAVLFADHTAVDLVFFDQLSSRDGAVVHQGDNRTGNGDGDDEVILVDLTRIPVHVTSIVFLVTSYEGHTFDEVEKAFCRLVDRTTGTELARFTLSGGAAATGMIMARVFRVGREWKLEALGRSIQARDPRHALDQLSSVLS